MKTSSFVSVYTAAKQLPAGDKATELHSIQKKKGAILVSQSNTREGYADQFLVVDDKMGNLPRHQCACSRDSFCKEVIALIFSKPKSAPFQGLELAIFTP